MRWPIIALLVLSACASQPKNDFVALSDEAAAALSNGARHELTDDAPIIYGVFTPVGQLDTSSPFGRIFADQVASHLVQRGVKVVEVRLRESIAVREGGPYTLSDDVQDIARRVRARAVLSGSYAVTSRYAIITARLIDVSSGIVISSWDKRILIGSADYALFVEQPPTPGRTAGYAAGYKPGDTITPWGTR